MSADAITSAITGAMTAAGLDTPTDSGAADGDNSIPDSGSDGALGSSDASSEGEGTEGTAPVSEVSGVADSAADGATAVDAPAGTDGESAAVVDPAAETDPFALEHGIKSKDKSGRENRIPFSRLQKINENAVKKARVTWDAEVAPVRAKVAEQEAIIAGVANAEHVMFNEPAQFVEILRTIPGYEALLPKAGQAASVEPSTGAIDWSKAPQMDGPDGYSPKGLTDLLSWTVEQAAAKAVAATEDRLAKRYAPIETAFQKNQKARETNQQITQATDNIVTHATTNWPNFKENHAEITKVLVDDSKAGTGTARMNPRDALESAYQKVVFGKLTTDRNKLRQEILAELKSAPASTSVSRSTSTGKQVGPPAGVDPIDWTIRQSMLGIK